MQLKLVALGSAQNFSGPAAAPFTSRRFVVPC